MSASCLAVMAWPTTVDVAADDTSTYVDDVYDMLGFVPNPAVPVGADAVVNVT